jgi:hypothetical protein
MTLLVTACGVEYDLDKSDPPAGDPDMLFTDLPPAPDADAGMRIITPVVKDLEVGVSHELCAYTGIKIDHTIDIRKAAGYQYKAGHHILLFASKINQPAGTIHECTDAEMASFREVAATGAEGIPSEAPGNLVYRVEADYYLVLQVHYINYEDAPVDSQSVLDLIYAPPGGNYVPAHSIAVLNTDLALPPGESSLDVHCTMSHDIDAWFGIPHMHQWGKSFTASVTPAGTSTPNTLWNKLDWNPEFMFSPPVSTDFTYDQPMHLKQGDNVDVHCEWDNTTSNTLSFGTEMCVFYMQTIDPEGLGNMDCDNGDWGSF